MMEQESTTEGGEDKWGRRYASSGLYSLVSSGKYRTALTESGRVALRLKSLLVRKVMFGSFVVMELVLFVQGVTFDLILIYFDLILIYFIFVGLIFLLLFWGHASAAKEKFGAWEQDVLP